MGVLSCDRSGCNNIMCDRLSHRYGYICNECFNELCDKGVNINIDDFMDSTPERVSEYIDPYEYFGKIFEDRS